MKRRAAYFLLCACFCFSSLSLSSSAVSQDMLDEGYIYDPGTGSYYVPDVAEPEAAASDAESTTEFQGDPVMLEEGWMYDSETDLYYMPYYGSYNTMPILMNEPNFSEFNPNDFPWSDMPSNIQEIIYEPVPNMSSVDFSGRVPFVCLVRTSTFIRVFCGWNICIGLLRHYSASNMIYTSENLGLYTFPDFSSSSGSVLYVADFNLDYTARTSWNLITPVDYGTTGKAKRYDGFTIPTNSAYDFYVYGANFGKSGDFSNFSFYLTQNNSNSAAIDHYIVSVAINPLSGFASGSYIFSPADFANTYFSFFSPKTAEQASAETQKGIWETLKSIPEMIGEKLKSLFVPSEGYFDTYISDFQNYFKDRFGLLYELPEVVITILRDLSQFEPQEGNYSIHFPEVSMPVLENGEWYDKVIIEERDITFDFLEQGAFKTLYSLYTSVLWLIFIVALINLIIRKADRVFGGSG